MPCHEPRRGRTPTHQSPLPLFPCRVQCNLKCNLKCNLSHCRASTPKPKPKPKPKPETETEPKPETEPEPDPDPDPEPDPNPEASTWVMSRKCKFLWLLDQVTKPLPKVD